MGSNIMKSPVSVLLPIMLFASGCSDYTVGTQEKPNGATDTTAPNTDSGTDTDTAEDTDDDTGGDTGGDTGEKQALSCDGSPAWNDPYGDGSLRLWDRSLGLDAGPWPFSYMCIQDKGRLNICEDTTIDLGHHADTVVGGLGMRNDSSGDVNVTITDDGPGNVFLLIDLHTAPLNLIFDAPDSCVTISGTGKNILSITGHVAALKVYTEGDLHLNGDITALGTDCGDIGGIEAGQRILDVPTCE